MAGSPRSRPRSRQQPRPREGRDQGADALGGLVGARGTRWGSQGGSRSGSDAGTGLNGDADYGCVGQDPCQDHEDDPEGQYPSRSQLLGADGHLEQELSSLIKRYRHERHREKQDYTIHV